MESQRQQSQKQQHQKQPSPRQVQTSKEILNNDLKAVLSEARFSSINQNIAEKFLVPFALILQASSFSISILSTLPQLLGACTQIYAVKILHTFPSRRRLIASLMFLQTVTWLPLFLVPLLFPSLGVISIIISYSVFYMIGGFFTPAWSSWIVTIVPESARGRFYGRKNQTAGRFGFFAATLGGYLLSVIGDIHIWLAYGILFLIACLAKAIAAHYITRIHEDEITKHIPPPHGVTFQDFLKHIDETSFGKYVFYMCCMSFAVNIAAPFFTPYMLHTLEQGGLGFTYLQFTIIMAVGASASFLVFRHWGSIADRFGNKRVFVLTGFLVPFIPLFWIFSKNFYYLLAIEVISGIVWAGFNLTTANYVFDLVGSKNRMEYNAYYGGLTTFAVFLGALVGSGLHVVAAWIGMHDITLLFSVSFLLRFAVVLFFLTT
ncbi:MAG: MFS transporter, partial [Nanoarchaeota archaeon]